jgi:uncharacterized Zn finger protein
MQDDDYNTQEWWVQAWLDLLARYRFKKRLERARDYARQGNVLSIDFQDAKVIARVRGKEQPEYNVSLWLDVFTDEQWQFVIETMAERAIFSAKLLAGEMPQNIEDVFTANGLSLFPFTLSEIHSQCSCPDPANPCKHIGAVYYLLGDRFSDDPFVLFQLRGREKADIISALRQLRSQSADADSPQESEITTTTSPSNVELTRFWQYQEPLEPSLIVIVPPPSRETVLDTLGPLPVPTELAGSAAIAPLMSQALLDYLKTVYENISQQAVMTAMQRES